MAALATTAGPATEARVFPVAELQGLRFVGSAFAIRRRRAASAPAPIMSCIRIGEIDGRRAHRNDWLPCAVKGLDQRLPVLAFAWRDP